jgi:hypothetical protein
LWQSKIGLTSSSLKTGVLEISLKSLSQNIYRLHQAVFQTPDLNMDGVYSQKESWRNMMLNGENDQIVVVIKDEFRADIDAAVEAFESIGMVIEDIMPITGVVTGKIPKGKRNLFQTIPAVKTIEADDSMYLL